MSLGFWLLIILLGCVVGQGYALADLRKRVKKLEQRVFDIEKQRDDAYGAYLADRDDGSRA